MGRGRLRRACTLASVTCMVSLAACVDVEVDVPNPEQGSTAEEPMLDLPGSTSDGEPICGNGILEAGEQCDGAEFNGYKCSDLGYASGWLGCDPVMCIFDTSMCNVGGDEGTAGTSGAAPPPEPGDVGASGDTGSTGDTDGSTDTGSSSTDTGE